MTTVLPTGGRAVMAQRLDPIDSLDFFPTPPWATRALMEHVLIGDDVRKAHVWEPAAGAGHMAEVLQEYVGHVFASDVHDYGRGYSVGSFVGDGPDVIAKPGRPVDFIITNPPFNLAIDFALRAIPLAKGGVYLLTRTAWLEGSDRFARLFKPHPPALIALFSERVPMVKGRWDPKASTATSYAWVGWERGHPGPTELHWIPPGQRAVLTKPDDMARFADRSAPFAEGTATAEPAAGDGLAQFQSGAGQP